MSLCRRAFCDLKGLRGFLPEQERAAKHREREREEGDPLTELAGVCLAVSEGVHWHGVDSAAVQCCAWGCSCSLAKAAGVGSLLKIKL